MLEYQLGYDKNTADILFFFLILRKQGSIY